MTDHKHKWFCIYDLPGGPLIICEECGEVNNPPLDQIQTTSDNEYIYIALAIWEDQP